MFSADTTHSRVWFTVANPGQAFEGELLRALGRLRPAKVIVPLVVHGDRGWWPLPDGGPTLSEPSETEQALIDDLARRPQSDPQAIDTGQARSLSDGLSLLDADMALLDSLGIPLGKFALQGERSSPLTFPEGATSGDRDG